MAIGVPRWGDYAEDTGAYRNWQLAEGDNRYGWGRLEIAGTATFIVRPNRYVYPAGYEEITPYWEFYSTNAPTEDYPCRIHDIAIGTNSQLVISDFGKLIAPYKIFTNSPIAEYYNDRDLVAQLKYYAGLVQAGSLPHYVQNGALSGPRLAAGPGQTLQFDLFPAGTNDVNEPYGGYFTVTAVPAPIEMSVLSGASLSIKGLVGRDYQIESTDDLTSPIGWSVRTNFTLAASLQFWNDPDPSSTNRFYRAALLPLPQPGSPTFTTEPIGRLPPLWRTPASCTVAALPVVTALVASHRLSSRAYPEAAIRGGAVVERGPCMCSVPQNSPTCIQSTPALIGLTPIGLRRYGLDMTKGYRRRPSARSGSRQWEPGTVSASQMATA